MASPENKSYQRDKVETNQFRWQKVEQAKFDE